MLRQYIKVAGAQGASFPFIPCHVILLIYLSCLYPACYRTLHPCCLSAVRQMLQALTLLRLFHLSVRLKMGQCLQRSYMRHLCRPLHNQDIMIFSKGKARSMRIDKKKSDITGKIQYMSGCKGMLPAMFDVQPVSRRDRIHQSELPVELCEQILEYVTYEGEIVLDSFAGSGAVGVAALNKKRSCILIEILRENIEKIRVRFNNVLYKTVLE